MIKKKKNVVAKVTHSVVKKWGPKYKILPWYCYPRKHRNFLKGLKDENEVWQEDKEVFSKVLNRFYVELFTSSQPHDFDQILEGI